MRDCFNVLPYAGEDDLMASNLAYALTLAERTQLVELWTGGMSHASIGRLMGKTSSQISGYVSRMLLARRAPITPGAVAIMRVNQIHPDRSAAGSVAESLPAFSPLSLAILHAPQCFEVE